MRTSKNCQFVIVKSTLLNIFLRHRDQRRDLFNANARLDTHERQIRGNVEANSMARHLAEEHPARRRDHTTFSFTVERAGEQPLTRQMREAQKIANEAPGRREAEEEAHCQNIMVPAKPRCSGLLSRH